LAGIREPVTVPTQKEGVIATQDGHTALTARTPEPGPLATIMTGRPVQDDHLADVFPYLTPAPASAVLDD
jgi:hypothetical protein